MPTLIILVTRVHFAVGILVPHLGVFGGKQRRVAEPLRNCVCHNVSPELEWASWDMDTRTSGCCPRAGCGLFPAQRPARQWSGCRLTGTSHLVHRAGSWAVSDTSAGFLGPARTLFHRRRLSLGRGLVRVPDGGEGGPELSARAQACSRPAAWVVEPGFPSHLRRHQRGVRRPRDAPQAPFTCRGNIFFS